MKKRKKVKPGQYLKKTSKLSARTEGLERKATKAKEVQEMNLFEKNDYFKSLQENQANSSFKYLKGFELEKEEEPDEKNWRIDDTNWNKLFEACRQCVRYCREKKDEKQVEEVSKVEFSNQFKGRKSKIDIESLKKFLELNSKRKVTKAEVKEFAKVSSYSMVKKKLEELADSEKYLSCILDLRKVKSPDGELIIPGISSKEKLEEKVKQKSNNEEKKKKVIRTFFDLIDEEIEQISKEDVSIKKESNQKCEKESEEKKTTVSGNDFEKSNTEKKSQVVPAVKSRKYGKPIASIDEMFSLKNRQNRNVMFDASVFELNDMNVYKEIINEISLGNVNVVLWLSLKQFYLLDGLKKESWAAQEILKTIALDDGTHFVLIKDEIPDSGEELALYCKENKITLVSGLPINVMWCKVYGVNVVIPEFFKKSCPSPFKGNSVFGVDSNVLIAKQTQVIFSNAKTIWVSDVQLREIELNNSEYWAGIAYFGDFGRAEIVNPNHTDTNLVHFFKNKKVEKVYSADYGFLALAKFMELSCELVCITQAMKNGAKAIMLEHFKEQSGIDFDKMNRIKKGDIIALNSIRQKTEGRLRIFTQINNVKVWVYDAHRRPKKSVLPYVESENGDELLVQAGNRVLIVKIVSVNEALGEVLFYGEEKKLPNNMIYIK
ncbi:MAG: hypothetical protein J6J60_00340 [Clostridia bacterium]|nr:hypothetical protein [Clostridia bacterium]